MKIPKMREYQERGVSLIRKAYAEKKTKVLFFLATGGGKSVVFLNLVAPLLKNNKKVLFLVKRKQLVFQSQRHFQKSGIDSSILIADVKGFDKSKPFQIASIDTAIRRDLSFLQGFDFVIIDEAHDATSESYRKVMDYLYDSGTKNFIGLTASPFPVGKKVHDFWDVCVKPIEMTELRDKGFLTDCELFIPSKVDLSSVKIDSKSGDYQTGQLSETMSKLSVVGNIVEDYKRIGQLKPAICFCVDKRHSMTMAQEFNNQGIIAKHCDESTPQKERDETIAKFKRGEIQVICNINIFSTGVDIPELEVGIMARPTRSEILFIQQVGRVFRPYRKCGKCKSQYDNSPNCPVCGYDKPEYIKEKAIIIDSGDNYSRHGHPYDVRLPALTQEDKVKREKKERALSRTCKNCYYVYDAKLDICPNCKYEPDEKEKLSVNHIEGELRLFDEKKVIMEHFNKLKRTEILTGKKPNWKHFKCYEKFGDKYMEFKRELDIPAWIPKIYKKSQEEKLAGKLYT